MFDRLLKTAFFSVSMIAVSFAAFSCTVSSKCASANKVPVMTRKAADENLVAKYHGVGEKYDPRRHPFMAIGGGFSRKASRADADSMRLWYSRMTGVQQDNILLYPRKNDGRFIPAPFAVFTDRCECCVRPNYLILVNGKVTDRRVGLDGFNDKMNTALEIAWLIGLESYDVESVEVMKKNDNFEKLGFEKCSGVLLITTKDLSETLIMVDGRESKVALPPDFDAAGMTVKDYAELLKLDPYNIRSVRVTERGPWKNDDSSTGKSGVAVEITTKPSYFKVK